jgi:hypothetical protein|tara:strand:- start:1663 stop:2046 length:384 start_codon:yes stop_codon:yes gene_type:complete
LLIGPVFGFVTCQAFSGGEQISATSGPCGTYAYSPHTPWPLDFCQKSVSIARANVEAGFGKDPTRTFGSSKRGTSHPRASFLAKRGRPERVALFFFFASLPSFFFQLSRRVVVVARFVRELVRHAEL